MANTLFDKVWDSHVVRQVKALMTWRCPKQ